MFYLSPSLAAAGIIAAGLIARLILAASVGLGVDESYVAAVAHQFSLSYFDHPPLHFWIIWLTAFITGSEHPVILRLPFILLFAGTSWLMYKITSRLFGKWAGVYATLLLNVSAVFSLSTGSWLLPDGPLMFFMLAAVGVLTNMLFVPGNIPSLPGWLLAGIFTGLGMLSKYHAVFIALGTLAFLLTSRERRGLLLTPGPYLAAGISFLVFLPVLVWNHDNGWVSFVFQTGRGAASGFYPAKMLGNIAGQAIWLLPWIWLPLAGIFIAGLARGPVRKRDNIIQDRTWFLCCMAFGPIVLFTLATLWGSQGLFHWQAPGYLLLFPLLGREAAVRVESGARLVRWWLKGSVAAFIVIVLIVASHTATGWLRTVAPAWFAGGDPTVEALDWREVPDIVTKAGQMTGTEVSFIASGHWIDTGKLAYALAGKYPVLCLSKEPHHFAFMHGQSEFKGKNALLIGRKSTMGEAVKEYGPYFDAVIPLGEAQIHRYGRPEVDLVLFLGRNFHGDYPLPYGRQ
ncbi:MAG TPA: glycosyltransferase family 39 protein [Methylomusa anaerophila]|uniref:Dolichyl-phosphate-mannose-protein mannosyltransferase n=1 Tax=Methylomusa anaerophila TaxID=1930071 RepID=A0A348ALD1_9FIRM|nr:glycosyltransferase family 39 protein [Methylomusa anaerophila]BBB91879.1 dolichyl-phosphate-mannose-protein mannosyltransferase [Methylomusa anaerophila]HML88390.1 glycosyltransferase family 39 protein [Methylomusa anaerophila]